MKESPIPGAGSGNFAAQEIYLATLIWYFMILIRAGHAYAKYAKYADYAHMQNMQMRMRIENLIHIFHIQREKN